MALPMDADQEVVQVVAAACAAQWLARPVTGAVRRRLMRESTIWSGSSMKFSASSRSSRSRDLHPAAVLRAGQECGCPWGHPIGRIARRFHPGRGAAAVRLHGAGRARHPGADSVRPAADLAGRLPMAGVAMMMT